jgi:hypothetical protein
MALDLFDVRLYVNGEISATPFTGVDKNVLVTTNVGDRLYLNSGGTYNSYVVAEKFYVSEPQNKGMLCLNVAKVVTWSV